MAAPSKAISDTFAYSSSGAENHFSSSEWYSLVTVENATPVALNVCVDGGTATAGAGTNMLTVPPNSIASFGNLQALPNADVPGQSETASTGWTAQKGYTGTALTYCSVIPQSSATGEVTISFQ
jgi:hypothetical protein